jgi:hypothetical protein
MNGIYSLINSLIRICLTGKSDRKSKINNDFKKPSTQVYQSLLPTHRHNPSQERSDSIIFRQFVPEWNSGPSKECRSGLWNNSRTDNNGQMDLRLRRGRY